MSAAARPAESFASLLERHAVKQILRLVVVGSVDDGKSTLIGRLLHESGALFDDHVASVRKASLRGAAAGEDEAPIDFSLFTDGLSAEREQGITIDVAYRYFSTARRRIIVADTPGHLQYTRNMVTGASTADAAVILLDARLGVLAQTRRHAFIASLLGIPYLAVAINKMDAVSFDPLVFDRIAREFAAFASSLGFEQVRYFPVSAQQGDNVARPSARTPWHEGGTLLSWLESVPHRAHAVDAPFRFPVQHVIRPHQDYRGLAGQIASGTVRVADEVVVLPSGRKARIAAIDSFGRSLQEASAPASVTLRLEEEIDACRGDLLADPTRRPHVARELSATLVWFGERPLDVTRRYLLKHGTRVVPAHVAEVEGRVDLETLQHEPATTLQLNDIGRVHLRCKRPLAFDAYRDNRHAGAFIVIDAQTNDTVAAGMILDAVEELGDRHGASLVSACERRARLGHAGGVVLLPPVDDAADAARILERRLFDLGRVAAVAGDDVHSAVALTRAGVLALVHARGARAAETLREALCHSDVCVLELEAPSSDDWASQVAAWSEETP